MRPVQHFSDEYIEQCKSASPEQALRFLEEFRQLQMPARAAKSRLISLRVPEPLLAAFRQRCEQEGVKYQAQIKRLMQEWLVGSTTPRAD